MGWGAASFVLCTPVHSTDLANGANRWPHTTLVLLAAHTSVSATTPPGIDMPGPVRGSRSEFTDDARFCPCMGVPVGGERQHRRCTLQRRPRCVESRPTSAMLEAHPADARGRLRQQPQWRRCSSQAGPSATVQSGSPTGCGLGPRTLPAQLHTTERTLPRLRGTAGLGRANHTPPRVVHLLRPGAPQRAQRGNPAPPRAAWKPPPPFFPNPRAQTLR